MAYSMRDSGDHSPVGHDGESVFSKGSSSRSKTSNTTLTRGSSIVGKLEDTLFFFLVSIKLPKALPNWLFILLSILLMEQSITLGWESEFNWGETAKLSVRIIAVPRTLGASWYPYELFLAVAVILAVLELIALVAIYYAYKALHRGSKHSAKIKNTIRAICMVFGVLGLGFVFCLTAFWACDYSKQGIVVDGVAQYALRRFPTIACWSPLNGSFAAISLLFMILQLPLTFLGILLSCDTSVEGKSWLSMDSPVVFASAVVINQIHLIISQILPPQAFIARPLLYLFFTILIFGFLVYDLPFHHRIVNSIFGGLYFSKMGAGISSILAIVANDSLREDLGLGYLFGVGFGSVIIFFFIGFAIVEIYTQIVMKYVRRKLSDFKNENITVQTSVNELVNPKFLNLYLKFSIKTNEDELITNLIKVATNQRLELDTYTLVISSLYIYKKMMGDQYSPSFCLHLLAKAAKKNSNVVLRYLVYQRTKEIEASISTGKNSLELRHILDTVEKQQERLRQYQKLFWKHFVSNEENSEKVYSLVKMMHTYMENSATTFNNLLVNYHNNAQVLRSYAKFLEEFLFEAELADEFYAEANILEDEQSKKRRFSSDSKSDFKKRNLPANKVLPVNYVDDGPNYLEPKQDDDMDNLESASQYGDYKKDKQAIYRSAINKPNESKKKFIFLQSLGFISIAIIAIVLGLNLGLADDSDRITTVNEFCQVSPVPYLILSGIRYIQILSPTNGTDRFKSEWASHKSRVKSIVSITQKVKDIVNEQRFEVESMKQFVYAGQIMLVPVLQTGSVSKLIANPKNTSLSDITNELHTIATKLYAWKLNDYMNIYENYEFLYIWLNRITMTGGLESFCGTLIERSDTFLNQEKQIFIFTLVAVFVVYVLFIIIYTIFSYIHLLHMEKLTKLFAKLPKDIVGTVFHHLEQKSEDKIVKIQTSIFNPKRIISALIVAIFLFTAIASALLLYECLDMMQISFNTMLKVEHGTKVLQISQRAKFKLGELLIGDSSILQTSMKSFHDEIIQHSQQMMEAWLDYRYGTIENGFSGITGISSLDTKILSQNCTVENYSCYGLDQLVDAYTLSADRFNEDAYRHTYSSTILIERFIGIFAISSEFTSKMYSVLTGYVDAYKSPTRIISPVVTSVSVAVLLILTYTKYLQVKRFDNENHQLRRMFNFIQYDVLEQFEEIRNYILYFTFSDGKKAAKGEKFSKTKAILDAAVDGAVVLNSKTGFVDIINPSALNMLGYKAEEVVGRPPSLLFTEATSNKVRDTITTMANSFKTYGESFEVEAKRKNNTTFPAQVSMSVSSFEKSNLISLFIKDITSEKKHNMLIEEEKKKSDSLLLNILPEQVAARLKAGETYISEKIDDTTCLFSDMVNFTKMSSGMSAIDLIQMLNAIINGFDRGISKYGLEKIKTIGDAYFCVGGLHLQQSDHPEKVLRFAMEMYSVIYAYNLEKKTTLNIRIGLHTGSVIAGCIGTLKFAYDLWGENVTLASKMESTGIPGKIQVTRQTYERVYDIFEFDERKGVEIKGKGQITTYILKDKHYQHPIPNETDISLEEMSKSMRQDIEKYDIVINPIGDELKEQQIPIPIIETHNVDAELEEEKFIKN